MKLLAGLLVVASVSSVAVAQDSEKPPEPWANKLFGAPSKRVHDFGTVEHGKQVRHEFEMTNIYMVPLEITEVRQAMGAEKVTMDKKVLQPNEKAKIIVTVNTGLFNGARTASIFVTVGPKWISTARLTWNVVSK
jgi:hypothetical protein